jgi:hypothetical protein
MNTGYRFKSPFGLAVLQSILAILCMAALLLWVTGCASGNPFTRPVVRETTVPVPTLVTNPVAVAVPQPPRIEYVTNVIAGTPQIITNIIQLPPLVVTNERVALVTNFVPVLATNYVANPDLMAGIESVRRANSALNPTPSAPLVDWSLTALGAVATIAAAWQTRRANRAGLVADTVIKAVETYPGKDLGNVKRHISRISELTGAGTLLAERVDSVTEAISGAMADGRMDANEIHTLAKDPRVKVTDIPPTYREAFLAFRENMPEVVA